MTKPNKDGWIRHRGGKCPVAEGTLVDVRYRNGRIVERLPALKLATISGGCASEAFWRHDGMENDILAFRLHHQETKEPTKMTAEQIQAEYKSNLAQIAIYHAKNEALVQQLREIGFAFVDTPHDPTEDMSDPKNWRVGDLIKCIDEDIAPIGTIKKISKIEDGAIFRQGGGNCGIAHVNAFWKFHSRPTKK